MSDAAAPGAPERDGRAPSPAEAADGPGAPPPPDHSRRGFLVRSSLLVSGAALGGGVVGCDAPPLPAGGARAMAGRPAIEGATLRALADTVLPASIGAAGRERAVAAFVEWATGFEPVAQEMLGYGDAEVRYLPADPIPAWRAQLDALDRLAQRRGGAFATLSPVDRRRVLEQALGRARADRLPAPLGASHVALALLAHWASGADAWNLALGARIDRDRCRDLRTTTAPPTPLGDG
jgi:hypothetical protein